MSCMRIRAWMLAVLAAVPWALHGQGPASELSLDSLLSTRISAASKYEQTASEAPASVTILTSDHLERLGYSRLGEVLESVRGFYLTDDRNYTYLGTRGFSRPTDYNNRILLLIDGHTINEQTWGGAPIGDDLPLNLTAIERIEIIRGPGSALYGTSAMFAVINLVTRSASSLDGAIVGARIGSAGHRQVTVAAGHALGGGVDLSGSALIGQSDGDAFYFPEYDDPETNNGITSGADGDRTASLLATLKRHDIALRTGYLSRTKSIATGAYDATFNDPRTSRVERYSWVELAATRQYRDRLRVTGRAYYDWYDYDGTFAGPEEPPYTDGGGSSSVGTELLGVWDYSSRLRLTLGGEYRDVLRAAYHEVFSDGTVSTDDAPFNVTSAFGQAEYQISSHLTAVVGVRTEEHSRSGSATAPRGALIITPKSGTSLKLLYGHAYRAPSAAEAHLETSFYQRNPALRPERIQTLELSLSHRFAPEVLAAMSLYQYRLRDLIDQVEFTTDGALRFQNTSNSRGTGVEFEVDTRPSHRLQVRGSYAYQHATQEPDEDHLSNVPEHIVSVEATMGTVAGFRPGIAVRHESGRLTLAGAETESFLRTDLHLGVARRWGIDAGLRITNVFDTDYAVPVGIEHRQDTIVQPGRRFAVYGSWRF
jgi:outer membrane receptor for ferrienterochelin and colicins